MNETQTTNRPDITYRVRFRLRVRTKLKIAAASHTISVAGQDVVLASEMAGTPICDSEWLVMNARGFSSEDRARAFGSQLRSAAAVAAVSTRLGVDVGLDLATSHLADSVRQSVARDFGVLLRDSVHGVDVFIDDPNVQFFSAQGRGSASAAPEPFLAGLTELHSVAASTFARLADVVLLLNFALMRPEPVAQIVFAVSAVEMLGQDETWTADQKRLLRELSVAAGQSDVGTAAERHEVSEAIAKSIHRLTLRQGVFRLLDSLDLGHLRKQWDVLYGERSALVHGLAPKPGEDYSDLARRTVGLCGRILLRAVAVEIPAASRYVDTAYPA